MQVVRVTGQNRHSTTTSSVNRIEVGGAPTNTRRSAAIRNLILVRVRVFALAHIRGLMAMRAPPVLSTQPQRTRSREWTRLGKRNWVKEVCDCDSVGQRSQC